MFRMLSFILIGLCAVSPALGWTKETVSDSLKSETIKAGGVDQAINSVDNVKVAVGMVVENWTNFPLVNPIVEVRAGAVIINPVTIMPGYKEMMVVRKSKFGWAGSYGTVSWAVQETDRRVVIMWSAAYDHVIHPHNWFAVGITTKDAVLPSGKKVFNQMYYGHTDSVLNFQRCKAGAKCRYTDDWIAVEGTMTPMGKTGHDAKLKIIVSPLTRMDLAPTVSTLVAGSEYPLPSMRG